MIKHSKFPAKKEHKLNTPDKTNINKAFFPPGSRQHLNPTEKAEMIDETNWGRFFQWQEIEYLTKYFDVHIINSGFTLLKEGQKILPYMGLIIDGKVLITKEDINGNKKVLAHIPKGTTFGEMSLIDGLPSSATVITEDKVTLMIMDKNDFGKLLRENPQTANKLLFKLLTMLSARLRETSGKLVDFIERIES